MEKNRTILHVDMDAFFASCEEAVNPKLRGKPLIVGGTRKDVRSIVSCPNYLARQRGIRTAMPLTRAMQLAPDGNFIRGTRGLYGHFSKKVREIFSKYTPLIEPMSIDEAYLDITDVLRDYGGDAYKLAYKLKEEIKSSLKITCSIGISTNKVCSKIASKQNKPDGITHVKPGKETEFLDGLSVERIPGVGKATLKLLNKYGIYKIKDIRNFDKTFFEEEIGMHSSYLINVANGIDSREVTLYEDYEQKSLSKESTLNFDSDDLVYLEKELYYVLEKACSRMRKKGYKSNNLTVKVKYADFTVNQKTKTTDRHSNVEMDFYDDSIKLFRTLMKKGKSIRLVGVRFGELVSNDENIQEDIFRDEEKLNRLVHNIDKIRKKYDYDILKFGKTFDI
ncbi:MAG TPA: DNA polymerase IV [Ignavibacteria bacterium]|nr:DNA polymerase IV [Ignavibacteria bacterium]